MFKAESYILGPRQSKNKIARNSQGISAKVILKEGGLKSAVLTVTLRMFVQGTNNNNKRSQSRGGMTRLLACYHMHGNRDCGSGWVTSRKKDGRGHTQAMNRHLTSVFLRFPFFSSLAIFLRSLFQITHRFVTSFPSFSSSHSLSLISRSPPILTISILSSR